MSTLQLPSLIFGHRTSDFFTIFGLMYIIKVKGIAKIPDYVQLRDEKFTLLAYFRVDRPDKSLEKLGFGDKQEQIMKMINELPFGQVTKLDI